MAAKELDTYLANVGIPAPLRNRNLKELKAPEGYFKALRDCVTGLGGVVALTGRGSIELGLASLSACATGHRKSIKRISYTELSENARAGKVDIGGDDVVAVTFVPPVDEGGIPLKLAEWLHRHTAIGRTVILITLQPVTPFDEIGLDIWKFSL